MKVDDVQVELKPYTIYDERGNMCLGTQIHVTFSANQKTGLKALSRVNYLCEDSKHMREFHRQQFIERAKRWQS